MAGAFITDVALKGCYCLRIPHGTRSMLLKADHQINKKKKKKIQIKPSVLIKTNVQYVKAGYSM
jgi:hypothetical protein